MRFGNPEKYKRDINGTISLKCSAFVVFCDPFELLENVMTKICVFKFMFEVGCFKFCIRIVHTTEYTILIFGWKTILISIHVYTKSLGALNGGGVMWRYATFSNVGSSFLPNIFSSFAILNLVQVRFLVYILHCIKCTHVLFTLIRLNEMYQVLMNERCFWSLQIVFLGSSKDI